MILTGQILAGEFAGSWAFIANLEARTPEELTGAESDLVSRAKREYRTIVLRGEDRRVIYRYEKPEGG